MATLKYKKNVKSIVLTLTVLLVLLVEPVLAKKARGDGGKSNGGASRSKQVQKASDKATSNSSNRSRSKVTSSSGSAARQTSSRISERSSRMNVTKPQKTTIVQRRTTISRTKRVKSTKSVPKTTKSSRRNYNVERSVLRPSDISTSGTTNRVQVIGKSRKAISSERTVRTESRESEKRPNLTTETKKSVRSSPKQIDPIKTSRIVKPISNKKSFTPTVVKENNGSRTGKRTTQKVVNKTKTAEKVKDVKRSNRVFLPNRSSPGKDSDDRKGQAKTSDKRSSKSLFTRPAFDGRQHVRPAMEKSQHIRGDRNTKGNPVHALNDRKTTRDSYRKDGYVNRRHPKIIYEERRRVVKPLRRNNHVYRDNRGWLHHRIIWPRYRYIAYYGWRPWFTYRYVYPYYHRKYMFVSLGGYWPIEYDYLRYYWYGSHPYYWYGYSPIAREVSSDNYNYYTYNYYGSDQTTSLSSSQVADGITPVDQTTFADVREKLAAQTAAEPAPETLADSIFEEGVTAFEAGTFDVAAAKFAEAMELAPEDTVLPFAYAQALFADQQYTQAAEILRSAIVEAPPDKEGVFYPRGLYADDDTLFDQIDKLAEEAKQYSFDGDLQLLLGYQLLGTGEVDEALEPLQQASQDLENAATAEILLKLLEKIKSQDAENTNA